MATITWTDGVLIIHVLYVSIVVLSVPLIIIGGWRCWRWVHNAAFRFTHLLMIAVVACESIFGIRCPLTLWENDLRYRPSGILSTDPQQDFIATYLDRLLFYHFPHGVFTSAYIGFALLVASLFIIVPVRLHHR